MSVGKRKAHGSNSDKPSRTAIDWVAVETKGRSSAALVVEAGITNEHSIQEETIETHLIPRKSLTTNQLLRIKDRSVVDSVDLVCRQLEKVPVYRCEKGHEEPEAYKADGTPVIQKWCYVCRRKVTKQEKITGKMIETTERRVLRLSDTTLLNRTKQFQTDRTIKIKGTNHDNRDFPVSDTRGMIYPNLTDEPEPMPAGERLLTDLEKHVLGLD